VNLKSPSYNLSSDYHSHFLHLSGKVKNESKQMKENKTNKQTKQKITTFQALDEIT